jgi:hypothetical protein
MSLHPDYPIVTGSQFRDLSSLLQAMSRSQRTSTRQTLALSGTKSFTRSRMPSTAINTPESQSAPEASLLEQSH